MDSLWDFPDFDEHEIVHFVTDRENRPESGHLRPLHPSRPRRGRNAFLALFQPSDAIADALRLSRGMSYKNAMAGLPLGGGKAVMLADGPAPSPPKCSPPSAAPSTACAAAMSPPRMSG